MKKGVIFLLTCFAMQVARSQWTTPNGSGNINNTNSANVGIGTTNPAVKLHVSGGTIASSIDDALTGFVQLWNDNAIIFKSGNGNGGLRFGSATNLNAANWSEKMRLTDAGRLGIGNFSPGTLLDVGNATKASIAPSDAAVMGLQVRTSNATSAFMTGSMVYAEQTAPSTADICGSIAYTVTSNSSGNVALGIPFSATHMHTGTGTVGEIHGIDTRVISNSSGNITNAIVYYALVGAGASTTGVITNAYGLYVPNFPSQAVNKYGVYVNDATASNYFAGRLGIGTTSLGTNKLAVEGTIGARKVVVTNTNPFPDYVFQPDYRLPSLQEVSAYIRNHHHLPEMPSADSVARSGLDLSANQELLVKKVEELTLYLIHQNEKMEKMEGELRQQRLQLKTQQQMIDRLKGTE